MRDYEVIDAVSGRDASGTVKASIEMNHQIIGSDGSVREVDSIYIEKPEIRIFKDADNIVKVDFVYDYPDDQDLIAQYMFLESFFSPQNSVKYSGEEFHTWLKQDSQLEQGIYIPEDERQKLSLDILVISIISLSPKGKYSLTTLDKPLMYYLVPVRPGEPDTILRLIFQAEDVKLQIETDETVLVNLDEALNEELRRPEV